MGVPWEERLTQFMLGNVIYASFPTMAMKKTKSFTGMIKTYVVYRVAEDLHKKVTYVMGVKTPHIIMEGVKNHFPEIPVYRVYPRYRRIP